MCREVSGSGGRSGTPGGHRVDEDSDVKCERRRVECGESARSRDSLILNQLTKIYYTRTLGRQLAVDRLCVGVSRGECFGLLGVNGAGKTTTFKMITGDTPITAGNASITGHSVIEEVGECCKHMGYCPQFDALYDELTVREHLVMYSRFKGINKHEIDEVVEYAMNKLGLSQFADKLSKLLSGGNKRKLSTAIALIGEPPVILLDEPTTGMDPHSRRFLWDLIRALVKSGKSVLLTSHSMEECEVLCTKLAIMVNGRFKCLGSIQHLKNRFGDGYSLKVRTHLHHDVESNSQEPAGHSVDMKNVLVYFSKLFNNAIILKERHHNILQYELPSENLKLSEVFSKMEKAVLDLQLEDYSISQNNLENVFIQFAKQQSDCNTVTSPLQPLLASSSSSSPASSVSSRSSSSSTSQRARSRSSRVSRLLLPSVFALRSRSTSYTQLGTDDGLEGGVALGREEEEEESDDELLYDFDQTTRLSFLDDTNA